MNVGKDTGVIVIEPIRVPITMPREERVPAPARR